MIVPTDLDYLSHRAEREAVMAASAGDARIAAIHEELSRLYAEQVVRGLHQLPSLTPPPAVFPPLAGRPTPAG